MVSPGALGTTPELSTLGLPAQAPLAAVVFVQLSSSDNFLWCGYN